MKTFLSKSLFAMLLVIILCAQKANAQCPIAGYSYLGTFNGNHYYLSDAGTNPSIAYTLAEAEDGYLASITSEAENNWLSPLIPSYITIGLNDVASEGNFVWHSGEAVSYFNWWPGEPNNLGDEDYVVTNFNAPGRWNDVPDWVQPRFVIEFEDSDGDGVSDKCDGCPDDANKTEAGICGCGVADTDTDGDGTADCNDDCPNDPDKTEAGICGCGVADTDTDGDGIADCIDNCINAANGDQEDSDCDGVGNTCDVCDGGDDTIDNNGDGLPDCRYPPAYADIISDWKCGNNKVYICKVPPGNPGASHTICVNKNAIMAHLNTGSYLGPCGSASCIEARIKPGHEVAMDVEEMWKMVPNPASETVTLFLDENLSNVSINVMDMQGKLMMTNTVQGGSTLYPMEIQSLTNGAYFIRLHSDQGVTSKKLIVLKN